jgi:hypothetical protein
LPPYARRSKSLEVLIPILYLKGISTSDFIEFAIWRDAPLRPAFDRSPRLAASAAPAAICCFFDFAGS